MKNSKDFYYSKTFPTQRQAVQDEEAMKACLCMLSKKFEYNIEQTKEGWTVIIKEKK